MCGIAGVVGNPDTLTAQTAVKIILSTLARRGPADEGIETWRCAVLGHRRLAIFDLSSARAPADALAGSVGRRRLQRSHLQLPRTAK